jgi:AcrR family transcriptional regulator
MIAMRLSKKDEILACAVELFQKQGFDAVTLNKICEKAGVTKTTFYYYYHTKEDVLLDYFSLENIYSGDELLSILASGNYLDQLIRINLVYTKYMTRGGVELTRELLRINLKKKSISFSPAKLYPRDTLLTLMWNAKENGQIRSPIPLEALYESMIYLLDGICFVWAMGNGEFDIIEKSKEQLLLFFQSGDAGSSIKNTEGENKSTK